MGGAFGLLSQHPAGKYFFLVVPVVIIAGLIWYILFRSTPFPERLSLTFVLSGAIGNIYDRFTCGYVVDFIQVHWQEHYFPAFNIADSAITIGAGLLLLDALLGKQRAGQG